ncbi:hypothetical protein Lser_V15G40814 [Lactuca serriola]
MVVLLTVVLRDSVTCREDNVTTLQIVNTTFRYIVFSYVPDDSLILGLHFSCLEDVVRSTPNRNRFNCSGEEDDSFFDNQRTTVVERCERFEYCI